ncbi:hypothetical protein AQUSIP_24130 [Aquicella siphonis]|uniref:Anti-sigma-28 factor FlgM C-terminal domain-containing protein n=1 Tax=Aquicella siphonis TaxID=254247 RepID=A0A5E4PLH9_9COXI|nr:flagellar biosynthesis anti-sigma factor FlgM [Aquicella siphonis]VVC77086.1 hypothetical protein AQUSIP_24130 [Aquicella siphonis]
MVNEVKLDYVENLNNILSNKKADSKGEQNASLHQAKEDGVHIRLRTFQDLMVAETSTDEITKLSDIKRRIDAGHYKVDTDELAKKLYRHLYQNNSTIG